MKLSNNSLNLYLMEDNAHCYLIFWNTDLGVFSSMNGNNYRFMILKYISQSHHCVSNRLQNMNVLHTYLASDYCTMSYVWYLTTIPFHLRARVHMEEVLCHAPATSPQTFLLLKPLSCFPLQLFNRTFCLQSLYHPLSCRLCSLLNRQLDHFSIIGIKMRINIANKCSPIFTVIFSFSHGKDQ